jgi:hypothetical protein
VYGGRGCAGHSPLAAGSGTVQTHILQGTIHYITLQDFNVHGANTTHGTESEVFRGVKREENPQYIELLRRISTVSVLRVQLDLEALAMPVGVTSAA